MRDRMRVFVEALRAGWSLLLAVVDRGRRRRLLFEVLLHTNVWDVAVAVVGLENYPELKDRVVDRWLRPSALLSGVRSATEAVEFEVYLFQLGEWGGPRVRSSSEQREL